MPKGPGPWPAARVTVYGRADGLDAPLILEASSDEAQSVWAVSHEALYLMQPGQIRFRRYTGADGLSLANAEPPGIVAVTGGAANEAWVGYEGASGIDGQIDPTRFRGKLDRVRLRPDGTLDVTHYNVHNNDGVGFDSKGNVIRAADGCPDPHLTDWSYNENRSVRSFLYDHEYHRGTLYVGFQHGVTRIEAGKKDPTHCFDYADHVHPTVRDSLGVQRMGDWRALALDPSQRVNWRTGKAARGHLWMGGKYTAGAIAWTPALFDWTFNARNPFVKAFVDPPVFPVLPGEDPIHVHGIAPMSDGTVYIASGPGTGGNLGFAVYKAENQPVTYFTPASIGLPKSDIIDMRRLPDDTVLIALEGTGLFRSNPRPAPRGTMEGPLAGLPSKQINRLYVDEMVIPTAVYVATANGFAVVRF
jgi:hypothetical protein